MRHQFSFSLLLLLLVTGWPAGAQEEESAEVYLETYSDEYQELFFRALQEKGIENFDRAESLLLQCKEMDPLDPVLDHELARVLNAQKKYPQAENYAVTAVRAKPGEYWYVHTLMGILEAQYKVPENLADLIPMREPEFRKNLSRWYIGKSNGEKAMEQLTGLPEGKDVSMLRQQATQLISTPRDLATGNGTSGPDSESPGITGVSEGGGSGTDAITELRKSVESLLVAARWEDAASSALDAMETYPLQPYFYLARGRALLAAGRAREAVTVLEMGEDLLLETDDIALGIYGALSEAHTALGNSERAAAYQQKIKDGS